MCKARQNLVMNWVVVVSVLLVSTSGLVVENAVEYSITMVVGKIKE